MSKLKINRDFISKRLLTDFSWAVLAKAAAMTGFFALDISMARALGKDGYGEWSFFYSAVIMMAHICWFGINASVKVFVSKQETEESVSDCLKAGIRLRLIVSAFFFAGVTVCSVFFSEFLKRSGKYENLYILVYGAGALVFLSSFSEFYKAVSIGLRQYRQLFFITLMEYGGYFVFSLVGVLVLRNNTGVLAGYIMAGIFTFLTGYALIKTHLLREKSYEAGQGQLQKEIFRYAMPLLITSIGEILLEESDTFFLGMFSIPAQVSVYAIGKKLCARIHHINYTFCITVLPQFSLIDHKNYKEKCDRFCKYAVLNSALSACVAVGLLLTSRFLIHFLYGREYDEAVTIFRILLIYYLQHSISYYFALFLEFQKKAVFEGVCYFITIILNVALEVYLVPLYGAYGAAVATIISFTPYTILIVMKAMQVLKTYKRKYTVG